MTVIGMWIAIIGYGLAYAGGVKVGGGSCGFLEGFKGQCSTAKTTGTQAQSGTTLLAAAQAQQSQQAGIIPNAPIPQPQVQAA